MLAHPRTLEYTRQDSLCSVVSGECQLTGVCPVGTQNSYVRMCEFPATSLENAIIVQHIGLEPLTNTWTLTSNSSVSIFSIFHFKRVGYP